MTVWGSHLHPRSRERMTPESVFEILAQLMKHKITPEMMLLGTDSDEDPKVISCCVWPGKTNKEGYPVMLVRAGASSSGASSNSAAPVTVEPEPGKTKRRQAVATRVLAYLFCDDETLTALGAKPKGAFPMICGREKECIKLSHLAAGTKG